MTPATHTAGEISVSNTAGHERHGQSALTDTRGRDVAIVYGVEAGDAERLAACWNAMIGFDLATVERIGRSLQRHNGDEINSLLDDEGGRMTGREAYEADVARRPTYHDGTARRAWEALPDHVRATWERNPTPRTWEAVEAEQASSGIAELFATAKREGRA